MGRRLAHAGISALAGATIAPRASTRLLGAEQALRARRRGVAALLEGRGPSTSSGQAFGPPLASPGSRRAVNGRALREFGASNSLRSKRPARRRRVALNLRPVPVPARSSGAGAREALASIQARPGPMAAAGGSGRRRGWCIGPMARGSLILAGLIYRGNPISVGGVGLSGVSCFAHAASSLSGLSVSGACDRITVLIRA